jgi:hypothetical protein
MSFFNTLSLLDIQLTQAATYTPTTWTTADSFLSASKTGKLAAAVLAQSSTISAPTVVNHGQIRRISLPANWVEGQSASGGIGSRSFREVHPVEAPDANLCFYYRGLPISEETGKHFRAMLNKPPHILTQTEIRSISEVLRGKDNPRKFSAQMIKSEDINGKRVLTVNGRLIEKQEDVKAMLVDADGTGTVIQEIYFQAPKELYLRFMKSARDAMNSIVWKQ